MCLEQRTAKRESWLKSFPHAAQAWRRYRWFYAYAQPAETQAEAALRALLEFQPLLAFRPLYNIVEFDIGRVYALAGRFARLSSHSTMPRGRVERSTSRSRARVRCSTWDSRARVGARAPPSPRVSVKDVDALLIGSSCVIVRAS